MSKLHFYLHKARTSSADGVLGSVSNSSEVNGLIDAAAGLAPSALTQAPTDSA